MSLTSQTQKIELQQAMINKLACGLFSEPRRLVDVSVHEFTSFLMSISALNVTFRICSGAKTFLILERLKDCIENNHKT